LCLKLADERRKEDKTLMKYLSGRTPVRGKKGGILRGRATEKKRTEDITNPSAEGFAKRMGRKKKESIGEIASVNMCKG